MQTCSFVINTYCKLFICWVSCEMLWLPLVGSDTAFTVCLEPLLWKVMTGNIIRVLINKCKVLCKVDVCAYPTLTTYHNALWDTLSLLYRVQSFSRYIRTALQNAKLTIEWTTSWEVHDFRHSHGLGYLFGFILESNVSCLVLLPVFVSFPAFFYIVCPAFVPH